MNRALDKPAEPEQQVQHKHEGKLEIVIKKPWSSN
jgi:hypothetical protein